MKRFVFGLIGIFCTLIAPCSAVLIDAGTVKIQSDDIQADQNDGIRAGYDFRFKYYPNCTNTDDSHGKYYLNDNSQASLDGYMSAVYEQSNTQVLGVNYYPITPASIGETAWVMWHFDFSQAGSDYSVIDQLYVKIRSNVEATGAMIKNKVSTDGITWHDIFSINDVQSNSQYWDLTSYVQGSSEYYIKSTLYSPENFSNATIFRQNDYQSFDNEVWLIPEPAAMLFLLAGSLGSIAWRKI